MNPESRSRCPSPAARGRSRASGPAAAAASYVGLAHDACAERVQTLRDPLVAAVDLMDRMDDALSLRAERGQEQGHAGADVGAGDLRADEAVAADDDGAVRVAEDDARAHLDQFVGEEEARLE